MRAARSPSRERAAVVTGPSAFDAKASDLRSAILWDLVTVGSVSSVATAAHTSKTYAADLAAGIWVPNSSSVNWFVPRGVYDPTASYGVGDAVLFTPDAGPRWDLWRGSVSDDPNRASSPRAARPSRPTPPALRTRAPRRSSRGRVNFRCRAWAGASCRRTPRPGRPWRREGWPCRSRSSLAWVGSGGAIQPRNTSKVPVVFELRVDGLRVATQTIAPGQDHALLVGAGSVAVQPGSMFELVNVGAALKATAVSLGIAGYHV